MRKSAKISECNTYRYLLTHNWDDAGKRVLFIMLNPSTADATKDDPTIRRCVNFAKSWGYGKMAVVNLFAFRATDPDDLKKAGLKHGLEHIQGPDNYTEIVHQAKRADKVVLAWGLRGNMFMQGDAITELLRGLKVKLYYIQLSSIWEMPCHPLFLKKKLKPKRYRPWRKNP